MKFILIFFLFNIIPLLSNAQNTEITGLVRNEKLQTISSAVIRLIKPDKDSTTIAFALTNIRGEYKISGDFKEDTLLLVTQMLGYQKQFFVLSIINITKLEHDIILKEKETVLNEVIVRKQIAIRITKDTTTYKVKEFLDGSEKNVEDVLKKLPGVQVSEGGNITFKGKKIDKITIEGEDFFSKNYKLISKNMPSFTIDKVDAIENYNENALLKGITKSDKTILNLNISNDIKSTTFGNIQGSLGHTERYELQNTIFNLSKKLKVGQITNLNNVRSDPVSEAQNLSETGNIETQDTESNGSYFGINESIASPNISKDRFVENNAKLLALNLSKKISKNTKARFWSYLSSDRTNQGLQSNSTFFTGDSILELSDKYNFQRTPLSIKGLFEVEKKISINSQLKFQSVNDFSTPKSKTDIENKILGFTQNLNTQFQEKSFSSANTLEFTKKIDTERAFIGYFLFQQKATLSDYLVLSPQYNFLKTLDKPSKGLNQNIDFNETVFSLKAKYVEHHNKRYTTLSIGLGTLNNNLNSNIDFIKQEKDSISKSYNFSKNLLNYKKESVYAEINNIWELNKWSFLINSSYHLGILKTDVSTNNYNFDFFNNTIGIKFKPSEGNQFILSQSQFYTVPNLSNLTNNFLLSNQRNFQKGTPEVNISKNSVTNFNYASINMVTQRSFINTLQYTNVSSPYITDVTFNKNLLFSNLRVTDNTISNYSFNIISQYDKFYYALRTRLKVGSEFGKSFVNFSNDGSSIKQNIQESMSFNGLLSTGFDFPVNIETGFIHSNTFFKISDSESKRAITDKLYSIVRIKYGTLIKGNIRMEYTSFDLDNTKNNTFFTDMWLSYQPKKGKFNYEIIGNNIFNASTIYNLFFNNFYSTSNTYNLAERIIRIKIEYRFGAK
jgi:hypothetical protein